MGQLCSAANDINMHIRVFFTQRPEHNPHNTVKPLLIRNSAQHNNIRFCPVEYNIAGFLGFLDDFAAVNGIGQGVEIFQAEYIPYLLSDLFIHQPYHILLFVQGSCAALDLLQGFGGRLCQESGVGVIVTPVNCPPCFAGKAGKGLRLF